MKVLAQRGAGAVTREVFDLIFGVEGLFAYGRKLPRLRNFCHGLNKKHTRVLKGQGKDYDGKRHIPDYQG